MPQSIPSVTISPLRVTPGHLTKVMPGGPGFAHTNRPGGQNLTGAGNLQKIRQHMGLIPTQNRFFGIHTEYETEFAFSFKKSEVGSNVL